MDERIERLLEAFSFEEILEYNDVTVVDILKWLYLEGHILFPPEPA